MYPSWQFLSLSLIFLLLLEPVVLSLEVLFGYELIQVAQKFFNRIGISSGVYGGFVHLDVDREKVQEVMWLY